MSRIICPEHDFMDMLIPHSKDCSFCSEGFNAVS